MADGKPTTVGLAGRGGAPELPQVRGRRWGGEGLLEKRRSEMKTETEVVRRGQDRSFSSTARNHVTLKSRRPFFPREKNYRNSEPPATTTTKRPSQGDHSLHYIPLVR